MRFLADFCPRCSDKLACDSVDDPHQAIGNYTASKGKLMGFFRDPDQRILSGYHRLVNTFTEGCFNWNEAPDCASGVQSWMAIQRGPRQPILEFADLWKGGMTFQLTAATGSPLDVIRPKVTLDDAREAARRVKEGFAFVGITEEWDLSICLFHKMFGGRCQAIEFEDTRPSFSGKTSDTEYNTSELMGFHDDIDAVVYDAALQVFKAHLIAYNVTYESCRSSCVPTY